MPNFWIDHLVITAPTLGEGIQWAEKHLEASPQPGGQHPHWGTHNALLGLGDRCYLEILAPDPNLPTPPRGKWLAPYYHQGIGLATWALATDNLAHAVHILADINIFPGPIQNGSRTRTDGTQLHWQLTDPYVLPWNGYFPFLIDWGDSPHPAADLPAIGSIDFFHVLCPEVSPYQNAKMKEMKWPYTIENNENHAIQTIIQTGHHLVKLPHILSAY